MRSVAATLLAGLLLLPACASRERAALRDDARRFTSGEQERDELARLEAEIRQYADANRLAGKALPIDAANFFAWRKQEWWNLRREFAALLASEWQSVRILSEEAARHYGYEVRNFPLLPRDVMEYLRRADPEWRALVLDAAVFIEFRQRELLPLRKEIFDVYASERWSGAGLGVDLRGFLMWREREWRRLVQTGSDSLRSAATECERMASEVRRTAENLKGDGPRLVADLRRFWTYDAVERPPRLIADCNAFVRLAQPEWTALRREGRELTANADLDGQAFKRDVQSVAPQMAVDAIALMRAIEWQLAVYEREVAPMAEESRRFWRDEISLGRRPLRELEAYVAMSRSEAAWLRRDTRRFMIDAQLEAKAFRRAFMRFLDPEFAFGDGVTPREIPRGNPTVMDDRWPPHADGRP